MRSIIFFLFILPAVTFSQWSIQHFWPYYTDSYFISGTSTGYAVCDNGTIRKSTNSGNSWVNQDANTTSYFLDIFFLNSNTGWAVGQSGLIRATTNGGLNWISQNSAQSNDLSSVFFVNQSTGYISTLAGVIKTTNGGANWVFTTIIPQMFNSIQFKDANTGMITGNGGFAFTTTNSGSNWVQLTTGVTDAIHTLKYTELATFYAGTNTGKIIKTTNAGLNWQVITTGNTDQVESLQFSNASTGYFTTLTGKIFRTTNSGINWSSIYSNSSYIISSITPSSAAGSELCALGYSGIILKSTNYGTDWSLVDGNPNADAFASISFTSPATGYSADYTGLIYKTTNSGSSWQVIKEFTDCNFYRLNFFNASSGNISGDSAGIPAIWKTTDSGNNWVRKEITGYSQINCTFFLNENTGFACGSNVSDAGPDIIKTTNGGLNWSVMYNINALISDIYFIDINTGWACDGAGNTFKTTNSGVSWIMYGTPVTVILNSIYFQNSLTGFTCGAQGKLLRSTNGGVNWFLTPPGTINDLIQVKFSNLQNGCVVGNSGTRYITTNGGINWLNHSEVSDIDLTCAAFSSPSVIFTGGYYSYAASYDIALLPVNNPVLNFPAQYKLEQNYPNPFNPVTSITFSVKNNCFAELNIYDVTGKLVKEITKNNFKPGEYTFTADLSQYSSGVYFYNLKIIDDKDTYNETKKMILIK